MFAAGWDDLSQTSTRLEAVRALRPTKDFEPVAAAFKRIRNILEQAGNGQARAAGAITTDLLEAGPEQELHERFLELRPRVVALRQAHKYEEALRQIGFKAGQSYMETAVGRTALQQAGGGPQQFMIALQTLYWVVTTYGKPAVSWTGPNSGVITIQRTFLPLAYHEGGAWAIAQRLGIKLVSVRARKTGDLSIDLEVSW